MDETQTVFETKKVDNIFRKKYEFKMELGDFTCPENGEINDVGSCEDVAEGRGCKYLTTCKAYNAAKRRG